MANRRGGKNAGGRYDDNPLALPGLFLAIGLGPVGLVVSAVAMTRRPRGVAIAGLIVGTVTTILMVAILVFLLNVVFRVRGIMTVADELAADMQAIVSVIEAHESSAGAPPTSLAGTSLTQAELADPWGRPYVYELTPDGANWVVTCLGADGIPGTRDDLRVDGYFHSTEAYLANETGRMAASFGAPPQVESTIEASIDVVRLHNAVIRFRAANERLPADLAEVPGLADWMLTDPWGRPYELLVLEAGSYDIRSLGPDGRAGTGDDIGGDDAAVAIDDE